MVYLAGQAARGFVRDAWRDQGHPLGSVRLSAVPCTVCRVARTLDRDEAFAREWAGEELADPVRLVLRDAGRTLVIDFVPDGRVA